MAIENLRAERSLVPHDISRVPVRTSKHVLATFVEPIAEKRRPTTGAQGQFSLPYVAATLIIDGCAVVDQFTDEAVRRLAVLNSSDRIEVAADCEFEAVTVGRVNLRRG